MNLRIEQVFFLLLIWAASFPLSAEDPRVRTVFPLDGKEVVIRHDHGEFKEDVFRATGRVELTWEEYTLFADTIEFNNKNKTLVAQGRVSLSSKEQVITGEKMSFDLRKHTGVLYDVVGMMSPTVRYDSDRVDQVSRDTLRFNQLTLTSCAQLVPRWRFHCRKGTIKQDDYIDMRNVVLYFKKVPVFYFPVLRYPINKDGRATGFLFPHFGFSREKGFFMFNQFFWAIRPNFDLSINFDFFTKVGQGVGSEVRYLTRTTQGSLNFYYFHYRKDTTFNPNPLYDNTSDEPVGYRRYYDYLIKAEHTQRLPFLNSRLVLAAEYPSNPEFMRLFNSSFEKNLIRNISTTASWTGNLNNMSFTVSAARRESFFTVRGTSISNQSMVYSQLPAVTFRLNQQRIGKLPGYLNIVTDFQNKYRKGRLNIGDPDFHDSIVLPKLSITPSYSMPLLQLPWLGFSVEASSQNTIFFKKMEPAPTTEDPEAQKVVSKPLYLRSNMLTMEMRGPTFYRVFNSGEHKLKHVIEPVFTVRMASKDDKADQIPRIDFFDYPQYSMASLSLTSRIFARRIGQAGSPQEVFTHTISQEYNFDKELASQGRTVGGKYPLFSELSNTVRVRPLKGFSLDAQASYNYYAKNFTRLSAGFTLGGENAPAEWGMQLSRYDYPFDNKNSVTKFLARTYLHGNLRVDLPNFPIKFLAVGDYDFLDKLFRYGSLAATFDYQCMRFRLEVKTYSFGDKQRFEYKFGFTLGNLGLVSDFLQNAK